MWNFTRFALIAGLIKIADIINMLSKPEIKYFNSSSGQNFKNIIFQPHSFVKFTKIKTPAYHFYLYRRKDENLWWTWTCENSISSLYLFFSVTLMSYFQRSWNATMGSSQVCMAVWVNIKQPSRRGIINVQFKDHFFCFICVVVL